jgi:C1A family cysteine protease
MPIPLKQHITFPPLFAYCARNKFEKWKLSERSRQNSRWNVSKILSVRDSEEFLVDKVIVGGGGWGRGVCGSEHFE